MDSRLKRIGPDDIRHFAALEAPGPGVMRRLSPSGTTRRSAALVLNSSRDVFIAAPSCAGGRGCPALDPGAGAGVELGDRRFGGLGDVVGIVEGTAGQSCLAEQVPPALLQIEPAGSGRDERVMSSVTIQIVPAGLSCSTSLRDCWWQALLRDEAVIVISWPSRMRRPSKSQVFSGPRPQASRTGSGGRRVTEVGAGGNDCGITDPGSSAQMTVASVVGPVYRLPIRVLWERSPGPSSGSRTAGGAGAPSRPAESGVPASGLTRTPSSRAATVRVPGIHPAGAHSSGAHGSRPARLATCVRCAGPVGARPGRDT